MAIRVGVNGFGRIGRQVVKIMREKYPDQIDVVAFNDLGNLDTMAHLFKYDSVHGGYDGKVEVQITNLGNGTVTFQRGEAVAMVTEADMDLFDAEQEAEAESEADAEAEPNEPPPPDPDYRYRGHSSRCHGLHR